MKTSYSINAKISTQINHISLSDNGVGMKKSTDRQILCGEVTLQWICPKCDKIGRSGYLKRISLNLIIRVTSKNC